MKILVIDDHEIVREGVRRIFEGKPEASEMGEASNEQEALELVNKQNWDAVVLDISLGGRNGLEVLKEIKHLRPRLPVLILSAHSEEQYALRAFKSGASGYITKGSSRGELGEAIQKVVRGGKYITPALAEHLIGGLNVDEDDRPPHEKLSDREFEVLCLIASGKTVTEIAADLSLSDKTISTYRTRIMEKMGMRTNAELTHYAIQKKLVE